MLLNEFMFTNKMKIKFIFLFIFLVSCKEVGKALRMKRQELQMNF